MSIFNLESNGDGPKRDTLRRLKANLEGIVQTHHEKTQANADSMATLPRKCCKICCKTFDLAYIQRDSPMESSVCEDCFKSLQDGWAAFVSDSRYAFVKVPADHPFAKYNGQRVMVPKEMMDDIEAKHKGQVKPRDKNNENHS